jgi:RNA polymerase sigma factor (sigma-70 family)
VTSATLARPRRQSALTIVERPEHPAAAPRYWPDDWGKIGSRPRPMRSRLIGVGRELPWPDALTASEKRAADELLLDPHLRRMIRALAERLCPRDRGNFCADDLEQVGLLAAARSVRTYDATHGASRRTWAVTQARGWMQHTRYEMGWIPQYLQKRLNREGEQWAVSMRRLAPDEADEHADPRDAERDAEAETSDEALRVRRCMSALSERCQRILRARVIDERAVRSIADEEGMSLESIRRIVAQARGQLRAALAMSGTWLSVSSGGKQ